MQSLYILKTMKTMKTMCPTGYHQNGFVASNIFIYIINFKIKKICRTNQLTGFYMMATLTFNELMYVLESKKNDSRM